MKLTHDDIIQILKLIDESEFGELSLEMGDLKLVVRKRGYAGVQQTLDTTSGYLAKTTNTEKSTNAAGADGSALEIAVPSEDIQKTNVASVDVIIEEGLIPIKSPILGTFYRAPKPGAPPLVEAGTFVNEDDTVCIVEVMKLFSSIKAGVRGRITKICAEDGEMVEYQQVLFLVKPEENL